VIQTLMTRGIVGLGGHNGRTANPPPRRRHIRAVFGKMERACLALHRGSRRDMFANRSRSWACISFVVPLSLTHPTKNQGLRNSSGGSAMLAA
jgi:hypothetical protein